MVDWAGSFVSAVMQVLLDRIARPELIEFFRRNHIDKSLLEKLKMLLLLAATVLNDAEERQFIDPSVKAWFDELQNAAYDADDLLDEIATKWNAPRDIRDRVRDYLSSLNPLAEGLKSKLDRIVEMLKFVVEHKDRLGLKEGGVGESLSLPSATTSLVDEHVCGRYDDSEKIINFLLSNREGVPVVAIVGMGGVGKTTLAQVLYNDVRVRNRFQLRSWASISETSGVCEITKKVFESFTLWYSNITDLNVLQIKLKERLARQTFLIVLDGFWNENFLDWDILRRPFLSGGGRGSKIIVTTRSQSVAMAVRADLTHSLSPLSDEDIWKLFSSHAFKSGNPDEYPLLAPIGKEIVKKCNGLPLAAKALGSLLRSKEDAEEWENISNSKTWELPCDKGNILPALRLSYSHLPSLLKRCFAYCSIFPKGCEIEKWDLIYLWMAEGILPWPETEKQVEDLGDECFQELLSRSFFDQSTLGKSRFVMHDLINDLAQYVAGDFCYTLADNPRKIKSWARHLSYSQDKYEAPNKFEYFTECQQLRTFLPFRSLRRGSKSAFTIMVEVLLKKQNPLRVLSLSNYQFSKPQISIGNSLHLRYLNLAHTAIECLPSFVCECYNLETLILSWCDQLSELPEDIVKLVNLRHLHISGSGVTKMPAKFGNLKSLQALTSFILSSGGGSKISELGELSELHGALLIVNLQNLTDATEASSARLSSKKYLHELEFKWKTETHNVESETEVLDGLVPHQNVKRLKIQNFGGNKWPNWLGSSAFSRMVFLQLVDCESCLSLPSLGRLPSLKELYVAKMKASKRWVQNSIGNVSESIQILEDHEV